MKKQLGTTLVELMIAIFVLGVIGYYGSQFAAHLLEGTTRANIDMGRLDAKKTLFERLDCCTTLGGPDIYDIDYSAGEPPFQAAISDNSLDCSDIFDAAHTAPTLTVAELNPAPDVSVTNTWILREFDGSPIGKFNDVSIPGPSFRNEVPFGVEIGSGIQNKSFHYQVTCQENPALDFKWLQLSLSSEDDDVLVKDNDLSVPTVYPTQLCGHIFKDGLRAHCSRRKAVHTTTAGSVPTGAVAAAGTGAGCGPGGDGSACVPQTCEGSPLTDPNFCFNDISVIAETVLGTLPHAAPNCAGVSGPCTECNLALSDFGSGPLQCFVGDFWCPSRNLVMSFDQVSVAASDNNTSAQSDDTGCPGGAHPCLNTSICGCRPAITGSPTNKFFACNEGVASWPMGRIFFVEGDIDTSPLTSTSYPNPDGGAPYTCSASNVIEKICPGG